MDTSMPYMIPNFQELLYLYNTHTHHILHIVVVHEREREGGTGRRGIKKNIG